MKKIRAIINHLITCNKISICSYQDIIITRYRTCKIIVFSLFVLLLLYIFHKEKLFIEGLFIEDYIQEI